MEIKKCWCVYRKDGNMSFYPDRETAVFEARALHPLDRQSIVAIYETFAAENSDGYLEELWSDDVPGMDSLEGLPGGESVDAAELADIIKNGRGL